MGNVVIRFGAPGWLSALKEDGRKLGVGKVGRALSGRRHYCGETGSEGEGALY